MLCPTLPFGCSHHHLAFAGTMSIAPELFTKVLVELTESLLLSGFRRIVLLNGHGGNIVPASQALAILSHRYDDQFRPNIALVSYWELAGAAFTGEPPLESPQARHACEYETSLMLFLHPDRVNMMQVQPAQQPVVQEYIGAGNHNGLVLQKQFHFLTDQGSIGSPELATREKGEHLLNRATEATVNFIKDFSGWPLLDALRTTK
jgi:creatinine amidohydrolase